MSVHIAGRAMEPAAVWHYIGQSAKQKESKLSDNGTGRINLYKYLRKTSTEL